MLFDADAALADILSGTKDREREAVSRWQSDPVLVRAARGERVPVEFMTTFGTPEFNIIDKAIFRAMDELVAFQSIDEVASRSRLKLVLEEFAFWLGHGWPLTPHDGNAASEYKHETRWLKAAQTASAARQPPTDDDFDVIE